MENVRPVFVDIDAFDVFAIDIASELRTFVYDKTFFSGFGCTIRECCSEKARTDNEVIKLF
jgi:hypothetical protein